MRKGPVTAALLCQSVIKINVNILKETNMPSVCIFRASLIARPLERNEKFTPTKILRLVIKKSCLTSRCKETMVLNVSDTFFQHCVMHYGNTLCSQASRKMGQKEV